MPRLCKPLSIFFTLTTLTFISSPLPAQETRYIRDTLYVSLRDGPADVNEVTVTGLESGTRLQQLQVSDTGRYTLVRTPNGEQGWIQTQYLIETPTAQTLLEQAQQELETLKRENERLSGSRGQLEQDYIEARDLATRLTAEVEHLNTELGEIRAVSSNAIALQQENKELKEENVNLGNQVNGLESSNASLRSEVNSQDFRNGALAVIAGMILALILPRLMPKKRNEWA